MPEWLTRKIGPLPLWAWLLGSLVGIAGYSLYVSRRAQAEVEEEEAAEAEDPYAELGVGLPAGGTISPGLSPIGSLVERMEAGQENLLARLELLFEEGPPDVPTDGSQGGGSAVTIRLQALQTIISALQARRESINAKIAQAKRNRNFSRARNLAAELRRIDSQLVALRAELSSLEAAVGA